MSPKSPKKGSSPRNRLPFEPAKTPKKPEKKPDKKAVSGSAKSQASGSTRPSSKAEMGIPDVVSRRMVKRMALLCGIPTALGMSSFFVSYFLVSQELMPLPTQAVAVVSLGLFGLGVLGLSYGVLSTSWDEETPGSWLGWSEFMTNFGRMTQAWRSQRKK
jgi:Photosynthesis affected mutant 68